MTSQYPLRDLLRRQETRKTDEKRTQVQLKEVGGKGEFGSLNSPFHRITIQVLSRIVKGQQRAVLLTHSSALWDKGALYPSFPTMATFSAGSTEHPDRILDLEKHAVSHRNNHETDS